MAKENNYQKLSEVDYCIRQYFSRYMAPTLIKETRALQQKQTEEFLNRLEKNSSPFVPVGVQLQNTDNQLKQGGKWYKKTSDDIINFCKERWGKDTKFAKDYQTFLNSFYKELVKRNGGKDSEKLVSFAENYVANRFLGLIIEQLAREKVPKGSASYIAKKALDDSLLGLFPKIGPKQGEADSLIEKKAEDLYHPNAWEKGAAIGGSMAIDAAMTGGYGTGNSLIVKGATKAGVKVAPKAAKFLNSAWSGVAIDGGLRTGFALHHAHSWENEKYAKQDCKSYMGDETAIQKIQEGSDSIKKGNSETVYQINSKLERKIKTYPPSFSSRTKKEMDSFYAANKNQASKLLQKISANFSKQAVPYNGNAKPPKWMESLGKNRCIQCASGFYAIAMEMSREKKEWMSVCGKRMTFKEVAQRAHNYAKAAENCEKRSPTPTVKRQKKDAWDENMDKLNRQIDQMGTSYSTPNKVTQSQVTGDAYQQPQAMDNSPATLQKDLTSGWEEALQTAGLNGFGDVTKNMGYVLAMLPDMIIGMFTGKNPNLQLEDNLLPLAAIFGGMFIKNPLLKLLLLGFGGANLLNNAGHAALGEVKPTSQPRITYKQYAEEELNDRISNPAMKGSSMIVHIDGKPCVIGISEAAVDAYEKGSLPLSTLANAVLKRYDENNALAAKEYEKNVHWEEQKAQTLGLK